MAQPQITSVLSAFGLESKNAGTWIGRRSMLSEHWISSYSPVDGNFIGSVSETSEDQYHEVIAAAQSAQRQWREVPAPKRGEAVRILTRPISFKLKTVVSSSLRRVLISTL